MKLLLPLIVGILFAAAPLQAEPVSSAIFMALAGTGMKVATAAAVASFITRTMVGMALSALSRALAPKQEMEEPGIRTNVTTAGGTNPQTFILGRYCTAGNAIAPSYVHDDGLDSEYNEHLVYIIDLADRPITDVEYLIIDGQETYFDNSDGRTAAGFGNTARAGHDFAGRAWLRWHDGKQTTADSFLMDRISDPVNGGERPWTLDHKLIGVAYATVNFKYDPETFPGFPECKFVVQGSPLYDPRKDSTNGGSGTHRWEDESTWEFSTNPVVMIYNILRGLTMADGGVYGLNADAVDLPLANWAAAMNVCDEAVPVEGGGTEPRYRAGFEVSVADEPLDVIEQIAKSCGAELVEYGGRWDIAVGAPSAPVLYLTDDDIIVSSPRELDPFRGLDGTYNAVRASYPDPQTLWEPKDAIPKYYPEWEAEDGNRRLPADVSLPAVPYPHQVRRLMREMAQDHRRMRTHVLTLPPSALALLPLETISWTSERNDYDGKLFEVLSKRIDPASLCSQVTVRERDPSDYNNNAADDAVLPANPSAAPTQLQISGVLGFTASGVAIADETGAARRPAVRLAWNGGSAYEAVSWAVRVAATGEVVATGSTVTSVGGVTVAGQVLPATAYEAQAKAVSAHQTVATGWVALTTPDVRLGNGDLADNVQEVVDNAFARDQEIWNAHNTLVGDFTGTLPEKFADLDLDFTEAVESKNTVMSVSEAMTKTVATTNPPQVTLPETLWTGDSPYGNTLVKPPHTNGTIVTDDPDFGIAFHFNGRSNATFGHAHGTPFSNKRYYQIRVRFRVLQNWDDGSPVRLKIGAGVQVGSTQSGSFQLSLTSAYVADGVVEALALFSPNGDNPAGLSADTVYNLGADLDAMDRAYWFIRQNEGNDIQGRIKVGLFEIKDVTEAMVSAANANATAEHVLSAKSYSDDAGDYAGAAMQSSVNAEAARNAVDLTVAPLLPSVPTPPVTAWTNHTQYGDVLQKNPIDNGEFVTNDQLFGRAFVFGTGENDTFGHALGHPFKSDRYYQLRVRFRVFADNSSGGGTSVNLGVTLHKDATITRANVQVGGTLNTNSQGVIEQTLVLSPDGTDPTETAHGVINTGGDTTANLAFFQIRQNSGLSGTGGGRLAIGLFEITDITEQVRSRISAEAAASSEAIAVAAKDSAEGASALAISARDTAVAVSSQGSGTLTDQFCSHRWGIWGQGPAVRPSTVYPTGDEWQWNLAAGTNAGRTLTSDDVLWSGPVTASAYRVDVEYTLVSGNIGGAGFRWVWRDAVGGAGQNRNFWDNTIGGVAVGKRAYASMQFDRPSSHSAEGMSHFELFLYANASQMGTMSAKNIIIHRIQIYPITRYEASVTEQASAIANIEGAMSAGYLVKAQAGSSVSLLSLIAADGSGGTASVAKMSADDIILDGTVTANKINTTNLVVGNAQSNNFVSGSQGWKIDEAGNAEFNNLIDRGDIIDGAVSRGNDVQILGEAARGDNYVLGDIYTGGAIEAGEFWHFAFTSEIRRHSVRYTTSTSAEGGTTVTENIYGTRIIFQRQDNKNGTWSNWYSVMATDWADETTWREANRTDHVVGSYDSVHLRILVDVQLRYSNTTGLTSAPSDIYYTNTRNSALLAKAVVK